MHRRGDLVPGGEGDTWNRAVGKAYDTDLDLLDVLDHELDGSGKPYTTDPPVAPLAGLDAELAEKIGHPDVLVSVVV